MNKYVPQRKVVYHKQGHPVQCGSTSRAPSSSQNSRGKLGSSDFAYFCYFEPCGWIKLRSSGSPLFLRMPSLFRISIEDMEHVTHYINSFYSAALTLSSFHTTWGYRFCLWDNKQKWLQTALVWLFICIPRDSFDQNAQSVDANNSASFFKSERELRFLQFGMSTNNLLKQSKRLQGCVLVFYTTLYTTACFVNANIVSSVNCSWIYSA